MPTMNVSLTDQLASFVESEVESGDYSSQSEVVREALRLLHREKAAEQEKLEILRRAVMVGLDDVRQGRFSTRTVDQIAEDVERENDR